MSGFAMPLMRGFPCPVVVPVMGQDGPPEGVGFGVQHVIGQGVTFFLAVRSPKEDTLIAQLDYARYQRLCELMASAGKQALMLPGVEEPAVNDPLAALGIAHKALEHLVQLGFADSAETKNLTVDGYLACCAALGIPAHESAKHVEFIPDD